MQRLRKIAAWSVLLAALGLLSACDGCRKKARSKYFESLEKVGLQKREMLVNRVDKVKDSQEEAQEQFKDALEQFQALVGYDGGELEKMYGQLNGEYEDAESRAEEVRERIRKVENVAIALFEEWQQETELFENSDLRRKSNTKLRATKARYGELLATMKLAADSMEPVLIKLRDQVLFLKHNLNAQALGSLDVEAQLLQSDVGKLLDDMQASIAEADRFIAEMTAADG